MNSYDAKLPALLSGELSQLDRFVKRTRDRLGKVEKLEPPPRSNAGFQGYTDMSCGDRAHDYRRAIESELPKAEDATELLDAVRTALAGMPRREARGWVLA
jgi:hypothetical protein